MPRFNRSAGPGELQFVNIEVRQSVPTPRTAVACGRPPRLSQPDRLLPGITGHPLISDLLERTLVPPPLSGAVTRASTNLPLSPAYSRLWCSSSTGRGTHRTERFAEPYDATASPPSNVLITRYLRIPHYDPHRNRSPWSPCPRTIGETASVVSS